MKKKPYERHNIKASLGCRSEYDLIAVVRTRCQGEKIPTQFAVQMVSSKEIPY